LDPQFLLSLQVESTTITSSSTLDRNTYSKLETGECLYNAIWVIENHLGTRLNTDISYTLQH